MTAVQTLGGLQKFPLALAGSHRNAHVWRGFSDLFVVCLLIAVERCRHLERGGGIDVLLSGRPVTAAGGIIQSRGVFFTCRPSRAAFSLAALLL